MLETLSRLLSQVSGFISDFIALISPFFSLQYLFQGGILYLLLVYLACIIWVIKDITERSDSLIIQVMSVVIVTLLTPILGLPLYLLMRPNTTLFERYYEESSLLSLQEEDQQDVPITKSGIEIVCPTCNGNVLQMDRYCPHCGTSLVKTCPNCKHDVRLGALFCTQCGRDQRLGKNEERTQNSSGNTFPELESSKADGKLEALEGSLKPQEGEL